MPSWCSTGALCGIVLALIAVAVFLLGHKELAALYVCFAALSYVVFGGRSRS